MGQLIMKFSLKFDFEHIIRYGRPKFWGLSLSYKIKCGITSFYTTKKKYFITLDDYTKFFAND